MNLAAHRPRRTGRDSLTTCHARDLLATGGQLVDVRSPADFKRGALPGARNLPLDALCYGYRHLDKSEPVILYATQEVACARAARLLAGKGFSRIYHLAADPIYYQHSATVPVALESMLLAPVWSSDRVRQRVSSVCEPVGVARRVKVVVVGEGNVRL